MKIAWFDKINMADFGITTSCEVYAAHIIVENVNKRAEEMIETISNTSWIKPLQATKKATFKATSTRTIEKLVNNIHNRVEGDALTDDFGEYMISDTALCALEKICNHAKVPLAELLKGRISGNEGFDFHSECTRQTISFGEAKYSGAINPYNLALKQINEFIKLEKDMAELLILENFVSEIAASNCANGVKSYAAAFSINATKPDAIIKNALKSRHLQSLLDNTGLYLIGVEVNDQKLD